MANASILALTKSTTRSISSTSFVLLPVPDIARQAVRSKPSAVQLGIISEDGGKIARDGGLEVVMDRCCKIEHARFFGGLRTIGLNTGVITSRLALKIPV